MHKLFYTIIKGYDMKIKKNIFICFKIICSLLICIIGFKIIDFYHIDLFQSIGANFDGRQQVFSVFYGTNSFLKYVINNKTITNTSLQEASILFWECSIVINSYIYDIYIYITEPKRIFFSTNTIKIFNVINYITSFL